MKPKGPKYLQEEADIPHIGQMLSNYYKKKKIRQAALARDMSRHVSTIADYKKNNSMQTAVLWQLCHVLKYNFFADLAAELPSSFGYNGSDVPGEKDEEIMKLRTEIARLQGDKELLMELLKGKG